MTPDEMFVLETATALWGLAASGLILGTLVSVLGVSKGLEVWAHRTTCDRAVVASRWSRYRVSTLRASIDLRGGRHV